MLASPISPTSRDLLEPLRCPDDQAAWDHFVERYSPLMFLWARRLGLRSEDAADLLQDVFLLLVQVLPSFRYDPSRSFRGWLWTVVRNKVRDRQRRRPDVAAAATRPELDALAEADPADALVDAEYRRHLVRRALRVMRSDFAEATWRACWECVAQGRPAAEVARALGISVEAVYQARSRVLRRLRQEFNGLVD